MVPSKPRQLEAEALREKLTEAERKYYTNLEVLQGKVTRLEAVQNLSKALIAQNNPTEAMDKLVELSIRLMGVEKAVVCRPSEHGFEVGALRGYSRRNSAALRELTLSGTNEHISTVVAQNSAALLDLTDTELGEALDLCQAILCPIRSDAGHLFGLYVIGFSPAKMGVFRSFESDDIEFFDMITSQVSALFENLGLRDTFRKFVPFEFLELLDRHSIQDIRKADHISLGMHVMFADLRGFTGFSETMGPEAVFDLLNEYLATMEPEIAIEKGFINQYQGDAIMALFSDDADSALSAAIRMFTALDDLNERRAHRGELALHNGIGINSGRLLLGTIGSDKRLDSNVVGDAANLASRVEGMTKVYGARALVSGNTVELLRSPQRFALREIDRVIVAGRSEPVVLHELLDVETTRLAEQKRSNATRFAEGLACYRSGNFREARLVFADCLVRAPLDEVAALYLGRCAELILMPPAGTWDGTTTMARK